MVKSSEAAMGMGAAAGCLLAAPSALNFAIGTQGAAQSRFLEQKHQLGPIPGQLHAQQQQQRRQQQHLSAAIAATGAALGVAAVGRVRSAGAARRRATAAKAASTDVRHAPAPVIPPMVSERDGCVRLRHRSGATCDVSIYAAHVLSWCLPDMGEQLFTSSEAILGEPGTAIRGGVPICWPQFGTFETAQDAPKLKHGFVRQSGNWQVSEVSEDTVSLRLVPDAEMLKKWPSEFEFIYTISLGAKSMSMKMEVTNTGSQPLEFTGCLHTYFRCEACTDVAVEGLKGETVDVGIGDFFRGTEIEEREQVTFDGKSEIQLLYGGTADAIVLKDDGGRRRLRLTKMNMPDWVLWNIGDDNKHTLPDLGPGEQRKYVCVEPGFATVPQRVKPGATWCALHEVQAL
jgi:glucose-6-phosphate 1-epimerase